MRWSNRSFGFDYDSLMMVCHSGIEGGSLLLMGIQLIPLVVDRWSKWWSVLRTVDNRTVLLLRRSLWMSADWDYNRYLLARVEYCPCDEVRNRIELDRLQDRHGSNQRSEPLVRYGHVLVRIEEWDCVEPDEVVRHVRPVRRESVVPVGFCKVAISRWSVDEVWLEGAGDAWWSRDEVVRLERAAF